MDMKKEAAKRNKKSVRQLMALGFSQAEIIKKSGLTKQTVINWAAVIKKDKAKARCPGCGGMIACLPCALCASRRVKQPAI